MIYYWLAILENIRQCASNFCVLAVIIAILSSVALFIGCVEDVAELKKYTYKPFKVSWIVLAITSFLLTFVPTQKQAAFIVVAPAIIENKDVQDTLKNIPELTKLGTEYLVEMLKDAPKTSNQ